MPGRLEGHIALVTGSTQGFGRGILETFVREGASVLGLDLQAQDGAVEGFTEKQAYQIQADVTQESSWKKALETTVSRFGKAPSVIVHNAGWAYASKSSIDVTDDEYARCFDVNVKPLHIASRILVPEIRKLGAGGSVIVISSENVFRPGDNQTWYSASKAAVSVATKSMALEFAKDQIRFNTVNPTSGNTPLLSTFAGQAGAPVTKEILASKSANMPMGRIAEPSDVANAALFLADPASGLVSGAEIKVDGAHSVG